MRRGKMRRYERTLAVLVAAVVMVHRPARSAEATATAGADEGLRTVAVERTTTGLLPVDRGRDAYTPCAAFGEDVFLAAWQSGRTGPGDLRQGLHLIGDIVACRVDRAGAVLDAEPFVVCGAADLQSGPRAAFGGGTFLVVWQDLRNGRDWDVYGARVSARGEVVDREGFLIAGGAHNQAKPRVVWDGRTFLVVWQDFRSGKRYEIFCARVTPSGKVLDAGGIQAATGDFYHCYAPAAASVGGGRTFVLYLALGAARDNYRAPLVSGRFVVDGAADPRPAYTFDKQMPEARHHGPDGRGHPMAMVAGAGRCLAVWKNDTPLGRGDGPRASNAALFDAAGARTADLLLGSQTGRDASKRILDPDVVWDGSAFVVVWYEFVRAARDVCPSDRVYRQRIAVDGKTEGEGILVAGTAAAPASAPAAASDGEGTTFIVFEQHPEVGDMPIRLGFEMVGAPGQDTAPSESAREGAAAARQAEPPRPRPSPAGEQGEPAAAPRTGPAGVMGSVARRVAIGDGQDSSATGPAPSAVKFDTPVWHPEARWEVEPFAGCGAAGHLDGPRLEMEDFSTGILSRLYQPRGAGRYVFSSYDPASERGHVVAGSARGHLDGPFSRARFGGWDYVVRSQSAASPDGRYFYITDGYSGHVLRCLDLKTQTVKTLLSGTKGLLGMTAAGDGRLYVLKDGGQFVIVHPTGETEAGPKVELGEPIARWGASLALDEKRRRIYATTYGTQDYYVWYWDLADGSFHGVLPTPKTSGQDRGRNRPGPFEGTNLYAEGAVSFGPDDPDRRYLYLGRVDTWNFFRLDLEKRVIAALDATGPPGGPATVRFSDEKAAGRVPAYGGASWLPDGSFQSTIHTPYVTWRFRRVK